MSYRLETALMCLLDHLSASCQVEHSPGELDCHIFIEWTDSDVLGSATEHWSAAVAQVWSLFSRLESPSKALLAQRKARSIRHFLMQ